LFRQTRDFNKQTQLRERLKEVKEGLLSIGLKSEDKDVLSFWLRFMAKETGSRRAGGEGRAVDVEPPLHFLWPWRSSILSSQWHQRADAALVTSTWRRARVGLQGFPGQEAVAVST
jgi:hypothetical protein